MVSAGDPLSLGLITSLARPGGNITGLATVTIDLSAKLMELFAELVPGMKRVGVVHNPNNPVVRIEDSLQIEGRAADDLEHAARICGSTVRI